MPRIRPITWRAEIRAERANLEQIALATKPSTGDLLLLYTDGFAEHRGERYLPERAEGVLEAVRARTAAWIYEHLRCDLLDFAPPEDAISFGVIKKTE